MSNPEIGTGKEITLGNIIEDLHEEKSIKEGGNENQGRIEEIIEEEEATVPPLRSSRRNYKIGDDDDIDEDEDEDEDDCDHHPPRITDAELLRRSQERESSGEHTPPPITDAPPPLITDAELLGKSQERESSGEHTPPITDAPPPPPIIDAEFLRRSHPPTDDELLRRSQQQRESSGEHTPPPITDAELLGRSQEIESSGEHTPPPITDAPPPPPIIDAEFLRRSHPPTDDELLRRLQQQRESSGEHTPPPKKNPFIVDPKNRFQARFRFPGHQFRACFDQSSRPSVFEVGESSARPPDAQSLRRSRDRESRSGEHTPTPKKNPFIVDPENRLLRRLAGLFRRDRAPPADLFSRTPTIVELLRSSEREGSTGEHTPTPKKNSFIVDPENRWYYWWTFVMFAVALASSTLHPLVYGFFHDFPGKFIRINSIVDLIIAFAFIMDFVLQFCVSYRDSHTGHIVYRHKQIAFRYMKSYFIFDLLSIIPWDFFASSRTNVIVNYVSWSRVARVAKVIKFLHIMQDDNIMNKRFAKAVKVIMLGLLHIHIAASFFYFLATIVPVDKEGYTWIGSLTMGKYNYSGFRNIDFAKRYLTSLYFVTVTLTTVGFGDVHAVSALEMLFVVVYVSFNLFVAAYLNTNMTALLDIRSNGKVAEHHRTSHIAVSQWIK